MIPPNQLLATGEIHGLTAPQARPTKGMRVVIQRSREASVTIDGQVAGAIPHGLVVLVGIEHDDTHEDVEWLAAKIVQMRIFPDAEGKMNLGVREAGGDLLVISQFTLHASTKKGNRPGFTRAARPESAIPLYEAFLADLERQMGRAPARGVFGADMQVALINDGPVTIWMDSRARE
jgi:D-tyrosyl-tRNA(Tyr) deacylase